MNWIPRFAATLKLQSRVFNSCVWLLTSLSSSSPSVWMAILQATRSTHNMDSNMFPVNRWQCILILSANVIAINIDTFWMVLMLPMRACTPFLHCIQAICVIENEERKQFSIEGTNIIKFMAEHNRYSGDWYLPCKQIQLFYDLHVCTCVSYSLWFDVQNEPHKKQQKKTAEKETSSIIYTFWFIYSFVCIWWCTKIRIGSTIFHGKSQRHSINLLEIPSDILIRFLGSFLE